MQKLYVIIVAYLLFSTATAQKTKPKSAVDIYNDIQKLNFVGSVLYVAAHPDDENNSMLAYLENEVHARTAYLSLTRGDGGQNLIGPELRESLGVIRTQEMLAARRIDGAEQYFSRANDFGFSKNPDETLAIWGKANILEDMVWVVRNFKPDIIINRFDHRNPGTTHGHHTAASRLALEVFDLAADTTAFPEQLENVEAHQTKHLFFNTSERFYKDKSKFQKAKANFYTVDVGSYYPTLGQSNTEISAASRSEHQCQGMGTTPTRGANIEYLELLKGQPENQNDIFSGINTTWTRIEGGTKIRNLLQQVEAEFDFKKPSASIANLLEAFKLIRNLPDKNKWKTKKLQEIKDLVINCAGLFLDASTTAGTTCAGDSINIKVEAVNRSNADIQLNNVLFKHHTPFSPQVSVQQKLNSNEPFLKTQNILIPNHLKPTNPYWLNEPSTLGLYQLSNKDKNLTGLSETPPALSAIFQISINDTFMQIEKPITQKYTDPVVGEVVHPFKIVPPAVVNFSSKVFLFTDEKVQSIIVEVKSEKDNLKGNLQLKVAEGWTVSPDQITIDIANRGASQNYTFELYPPDKQSIAELSASIKIDDRLYNQSLHKIEYQHIPNQIVLLPAKAKIVRINLKTKGENIGYIMGAGDVVPDHLEQIGYKVTLLEDPQINAENLKTYDAIVVGIRAFNVKKSLAYKHDALMEYVKQGGNLMMQYNTSHRLVMDNLGPYPMKLSRDRVTVENAKVTILEPTHRLMNYPNKITEADFQGWVQERGLYFPNEWDKAYTALLSCHDPNEPPRNGGLLYAKYGEGQFIYTGYSWFRQLPAGVPGAYRIFANLLAGDE